MEARRLLLSAVRGCAIPGPGSNDCDDISALRQALLSYRRREARIELHSSGTALRFMTALVAATPGYTAILDGSGQLRSRPMAPLVDQLLRMGATVTYLGKEGYAPLHIDGALLNGDRADIDSLLRSHSSQYLSSLILAGDLYATPLPHISATDMATAPSAPYLRLTLRMVEQPDIMPETDWSAASYFYLTALVTGHTLHLTPALTDATVSFQGDSLCERLFAAAGVTTTHTGSGTILVPGDECSLPGSIDMNATPDLVPAAAMMATFLGHTLRITGISHLAVKESNRLITVAEAVRAVGGKAFSDNDSIIIYAGREQPQSIATVDCHSDHRIAMAAAPCAAFLPMGVALSGAGCVMKSFPDFFAQLEKSGFIIQPTTNPSSPCKEP